MAANLSARRKAAMYGTPPAGTSERNEAAQAVNSRIAFELEIAASIKSVDRGLHDRRLKKLHNKLDSLAEDEWKYPTIESLIGLK